MAKKVSFEEEMYGLEAMALNSIENLQTILATKLDEEGCISVIEKMLDAEEDIVTSDFKDQLVFIKNTTDLSNTQEVLNLLIDSAETLLDDFQIESLVDLFGESDEFELEGEEDSSFMDEEYVEPEDWSTLDEEGEGEVEEEPLDEVNLEEEPLPEDEEGEAHESIVDNSIKVPATEETQSSTNLSKFLREVNKVEEWYQDLLDYDEDFEEILGLKYFDGGDDEDYIRSAIWGFHQFDEPAGNEQEYIKNFTKDGYLTKNSSPEWKQKVKNLAKLFGMLTPEDKEKLNRQLNSDEYTDISENSDPEQRLYSENGIATENFEDEHLGTSSIERKPKKGSLLERLLAL